MRLPLRSTFAAALLLTLASAARARPEIVETLGGLAEKSDLLVVCEVTKIEDLRTEKSEQWNAMVTTRRATLRVLRGIQPADGSAATMEELTVEYPALAAGQEAAPNGPQFPVLAEGQLSLFPLKHVEGGWRFVSQEDAAMIMPAARRPIAAQPETPRDYLLNELAGALLNGDYQTMVLAGKYLGEVGAEVPLPVHGTSVRAHAVPPVADAVFALIRSDIGESAMQLDTRWVQMGMATYMAAGTTLPLADLLADDAPVSPPLQMARLALRKAGPRDLDQRIIRLLIAHQEDPGAALRTAATIAVNYASDPDLIAYERMAISDQKPGAMAVADLLVTDSSGPFAARAMMAAHDILDGNSKSFAHAADPETTRHAVALLLRVGSDDDFAFFLDQISRAKTESSPRYQQYLLDASGEPSISAPRCLAIARLCIDDATPLTGADAPKSWRICDLAARLVGRTAADDFGVTPDAMIEVRDAGVERARKYLKSKE